MFLKNILMTKRASYINYPKHTLNSFNEINIVVMAPNTFICRIFYLYKNIRHIKVSSTNAIPNMKALKILAPCQSAHGSTA